MLQCGFTLANGARSGERPAMIVLYALAQAFFQIFHLQIENGAVSAVLDIDAGVADRGAVAAESRRDFRKAQLADDMGEIHRHLPRLGQARAPAKAGVQLRVGYAVSFANDLPGHSNDNPAFLFRKSVPSGRHCAPLRKAPLLLSAALFCGQRIRFDLISGISFSKILTRR
jgi:hypothetical protein